MPLCRPVRQRKRGATPRQPRILGAFPGFLRIVSFPDPNAYGWLLSPDVSVDGLLGTGPFFGGKAYFAGKRSAENMDLYPSRGARGSPM